jgi:hypothetical protein
MECAGRAAIFILNSEFWILDSEFWIGPRAATNMIRVEWWR